jgi:hypothetical protein
MPIIGADLEADPPWYLMPLAERNLAESVGEVRSGGHPIPAVAFADILNGLEQLHALGYVHRDLKPENVLLHDGTWRLTDFGLVLPVSGNTTQITTKSAWGTASYAAPEQAVSFHNVTAQADIYSFGCILHDFFGAGDRVPFHRHSAQGPVGVIIEKCTERDPARRFQSIAQLRQELLPILDGTSPPTGEAAEGYIALIGAPDKWSAESVMAFAAFLRQQANTQDTYQVLHNLDELSFQAIHAIDKDRWSEIVDQYCEWAGSTSHGFSYCDLLARRLVKIVEMGDVAAKAKAIVAAASMAAGHNRWYAMNLVLGLCNTTMDDNLAHRVAVEIRVGALRNDFESCADRIGQSVAAYHPRIREAIAGVSGGSAL